jgi:prevent-host-death family protein
MQVAIRELRNHTKDVLDAVERGEEVVLTRSGEPVARIIPINQAATVSDWLDDLESEPASNTGWLDELSQLRREDDAADHRRDDR